ncbi:MAG: hypothetical protein JWQ96_1015 [Segetibacter sp.]|nr:hypothetical protein [Segetibacter sp.]
MIKDKYREIVFACFVILLSIAVYHHEPWMDEAQAWLLAKDLGVPELISKYLRYEGSPGLWHLVLMVPAKLGLPYYSINIISALFSCAGVFIFLRYSPFPVVVKVLFPFTYFVFYQYAVVARSYCMIPALLFLIAIVYPNKNQKPFQFILLLCLFANVSAHTFLISGCLLFIHLIDLAKNWKKLEDNLKIKHIVSFVVFCLMSLVIVYALVPPPDQIFARELKGDWEDFFIVLRMVAGALAFDEGGAFYFLKLTFSLLVFGLSVYWFVRNKLGLLYLLPLIVILLFSAMVYRNVWHQGILFFLWIFVLWISYDNHTLFKPVRTHKAIKKATVFVLAVQVFWSFLSFNYDFSRRYSASREVANYIKTHGYEKKRIFATGWKSISIQPYFKEKIFYNLNKGTDKKFWFWSVDNETPVGANYEVIDSIKNEQPDLVIIASHYIPRRVRVEIEGYEAVKLFTGFLFWKTSRKEPECYLMFRKIDSTTGKKPTTLAAKKEERTDSTIDARTRLKMLLED